MIVVWALLLVLGAFASGRLSPLLSTSLSVPGSDSAKANTILVRAFHDNIEGDFTIVVRFPGVHSRTLRDTTERVAAAVRTVPSASVAQERVFSGLLYVNVQTSLSLQRAAEQTSTLRAALAAQQLTSAMVTGPPALQNDVTPILQSDLRRGEIVAFVLALVLLVAVLGLCEALLIPFAVAAATIAAALLALYLLAQHLLLVLYVPNVVALIGLGLAIDYSLLIVHRFRREVRDHNVAVDDAIVATMASAGRSVLFSGVAVAIGLATLLLVPVPFVRSLGVAGLIVPVVALSTALTLQPALLSVLGRRGVRPLALRGLLDRRDDLEGSWARVTRAVLRRPLVVLVASLLVVGALGAFSLGLELTPGSLSAIPSSMASARALHLIESHVGPAAITPLEVVLDTGAAHLDQRRVQAVARLALARSILADHDVVAVALDSKPPFVDNSGRYARLYVISHEYYGAASTQGLVTRLRAHVIASAHFPPGTTVLVGGAAAQGVDFLSAVYGSLVWLVVLALMLALIIFTRAFRSIVLALLAVALDLVSVAVTMGLLVLFFRFGLGAALLGTYQVDQIEGWVPVFVFAVLFGLSSDYEVFIVSRVREAYDHGASTHDAIVEGLARTGGVVSAAAVILVGALGGLVFGRVAGLQELGVALALGVLIDATIVRGLILPSAMKLLGRWNWWLPSAAARVLRVDASPLATREARRLVK